MGAPVRPLFGEEHLGDKPLRYESFCITLVSLDSFHICVNNSLVELFICHPEPKP